MATAPAMQSKTFFKRHFNLASNRDNITAKSNSSASKCYEKEIIDNSSQLHMYKLMLVCLPFEDVSSDGKHESKYATSSVVPYQALHGGVYLNDLLSSALAASKSNNYSISSAVNRLISFGSGTLQPGDCVCKEYCSHGETQKIPAVPVSVPVPILVPVPVPTPITIIGGPTESTIFYGSHPLPVPIPVPVPVPVHGRMPITIDGRPTESTRPYASNSLPVPIPVPVPVPTPINSVGGPTEGTKPVYSSTAIPLISKSNYTPN
jgi:hypothetical protein